MKMEPIVSSETSAIRTQTPGNYPKRNNLQRFGTLHIQRKYTFLWGRGCKLYVFTTSTLDSGERFASRLDHFTSMKISAGRTTHYIRAWLYPSSSTSAAQKGGACVCCQEKKPMYLFPSPYCRYVI